MKQSSNKPYAVFDNTTNLREIRIMAESLDIQLREFENGVKLRSTLLTTLIAIVSFASPLLTVSAFKDFAGIKADVWNAVYLVATAGATVWWIVKVIKYGIEFKRKRVLTRELLMKNLQTQSTAI